MTRLIRCALAVALGLGALQASAESTDQRLESGAISYINPATLEIGIGAELYRLDSGFQIHGLGEGDRVELFNALEPGMQVQFRTTGSNGMGMILEIRVRAD